SPWAMLLLTGISITLDTALEAAWRRSSHKVWFVSCIIGGSNDWNIPSLEYHLLNIIGQLRDDVSERAPGVVCHKCRKPINPRHGHWVHRYPEKRWTYSGLHVPQIIMPIHFARRDKWAELLMKQSGGHGYNEAKFWNEVLGEALDE